MDTRYRNSVEHDVYTRYAGAAQEREAALCCPVEYDRNLLAVIPQEVIERDYGCGDPSPYVRAGDVVLDLGSGGGKICFIAAQLAGPTGRVIGVDCNREMLALARRHQDEVAKRLGYANVEFRRGLIQDLRLDLDMLADALREHPVQDADDWLEFRGIEDRLRDESPLIGDESVDCVLSNCVLNLVRLEDRRQLLDEVFRVLKPGCRAVISDIVADAPVPDHLRQDPELWSGCISGAYGEDEFLHAFEQAGFQGIEILNRQAETWREVAGIEFRALTVRAFRGRESHSGRSRTVIYRGPFLAVEDDRGTAYRRGEKTSVSNATYQNLAAEPYARHFEFIADKLSESAGSAARDDCASGDCCG